MEQEQFNYDMGQTNTFINGLSNATSSLGSAVTSGITTELNMYSQEANHDFYIQNILAQKERQQMLPNTGSLSGSNATLLGYNLMDNNIFTRYTIKAQFARRIDKYFDMYGYATNELKLPNINNRPNWNYVKTERFKRSSFNSARRFINYKKYIQQWYNFMA